jgi:hypothetical protein
MVAEGDRKLAMIAYLLMNGSLSENAYLLWDEPEANLNPKRARLMSDTAAGLARAGVQVLLATHDYALTSELALQVDTGGLPAGDAAFFALHRHPSEGGVVVERGQTEARRPPGERHPRHARVAARAGAGGPLRVGSARATPLPAAFATSSSALVSERIRAKTAKNRKAHVLRFAVLRGLCAISSCVRSRESPPVATTLHRSGSPVSQKSRGYSRTTEVVSPRAARSSFS